MPTSVMESAEVYLAQLASQGLELPDFWHAASEVLSRAVPHYSTPCWWTLDPESLLVTSHVQTEVVELPADMLTHEYLEDDFHKLADVARSARGVSTIHEVTGGDPSKSPGWRQFVNAYGADQEVLVALRTRSGATWGIAGLYRAEGQPWSCADELRFLQNVASILGNGARRGLLVGEARDPEGPGGPGLVILSQDWGVRSVTPGTERWLDELPGSRWQSSGELPTAIMAIASHTLATARTGDLPQALPVARARAQSGVWLELHGAMLHGNDESGIAVIVEPVEPVRVASLLMAAYDLTAREQDVARLVLKGLATAEIASILTVRPQTVQQHLKSIFEKTGVRSRRELVGKVFFGHFEPRLRENEQRSSSGFGLRGTPRKHSAVR